MGFRIRMRFLPIAAALSMLAAPPAMPPAGNAQQTHPAIHTEADDANWSGLVESMMKMHGEMSAVDRTGNADADFVRLMLPHHQAAVDMAKVQLLHGKDPQMRRLAQEIITDQQLEIELMRLWLKQQPASK